MPLYDHQGSQTATYILYTHYVSVPLLPETRALPTPQPERHSPARSALLLHPPIATTPKFVPPLVGLLPPSEAPPTAPDKTTPAQTQPLWGARVRTIPETMRAVPFVLGRTLREGVALHYRPLLAAPRGARGGC